MEEWVAVIVSFIVVKRNDLKWDFYFGYKHDTSDNIQFLSKQYDQFLLLFLSVVHAQPLNAKPSQLLWTMFVLQGLPVNETEKLCETASPNVSSGNTHFFFTKPTFQFRHNLVAASQG